MKNQLVFIATPYSHSDPTIVEQRRKTVGNVCARLIEKGVHPISPGLYGLSLMEFKAKEDTSWESWSDLCIAILKKCSAMFIIDVKDWEKSNGVKGELEKALLLDIPVYLLNPETLEINKFKQL